MLLVLSCFFLYLFLSIVSAYFNVQVIAFEKVNLISEIFKTPKNNPEERKPIKLKIEAGLTHQDFELYKKPVLVTNFYPDSTALLFLAEKIRLLQQGKKVKIRIAYFGDSMIEGDLLTQNLRQLLQEKFGGSGVGYLPINSPVSGFRRTAYDISKGFDTENFKTKNAKNMYLSGYMFSGNGYATFTDKTIRNSSLPIQKYILFQDKQSVNYNGKITDLDGDNIFNRQILSTDSLNTIKLQGNSSGSKIFGVGFESENGIILDNFSFRGITGVELKKLDENFLKEISEKNPYDLIVFQYGVNMLFRPNDTDYSYYKKIFTPVLQNFKKAFPKSDFLIVSSADRAFRYDGEYKSAVGIQNLIELQAEMAFDNKMAFYNQFESMGGENSIVKWAQSTPSLAGQDYVHPNAKGGEILAGHIFQAMLNDFAKSSKKKISKK